LAARGIVDAVIVADGTNAIYKQRLQRAAKAGTDLYTNLNQLLQACHAWGWPMSLLNLFVLGPLLGLRLLLGPLLDLRLVLGLLVVGLRLVLHHVNSNLKLTHQYHVNLILQMQPVGMGEDTL
jgi:hypothetical protein